MVALVRSVDDGGANDTGMVHNDGIEGTLLLRKVLGDVGHGDVVEGDVSNLTLTVIVGVPNLDVALLQVSEACEWNRSSALASEVHRSLHHVTRSAAIVSTGTVAVLGHGRETMRRVETNAAGAVHRTLKLRQVVRTREGLLSAGGAKLVAGIGIEVGKEEARTTEWCLLHDGRVAELLHQGLTTLDRGVRDLSSLGRAVGCPATTLDAVDEGDHATDVGEIDEGVAHVAARLEVNAEVEEVICAKADFVKNGLERHLGSSVQRYKTLEYSLTQSILLGILRNMMVVRTSLPSRIRSRRTRLC